MSFEGGIIIGSPVIVWWQFASASVTSPDGHHVLLISPAAVGKAYRA